MYLRLECLWIVLGFGCGNLGGLVTDSCTATYCFEKAEEYFGFPVPALVYAANAGDLVDLCGPGAVACNVRGSIRVLEKQGDDEYYYCTRILHELGHSAAMLEKDETWDASHKRFRDFYSTWIFQACQDDTCKGEIAGGP